MEAVRFNLLNSTIMAAVVNITVHTAVTSATATIQPDGKQIQLRYDFRKFFCYTVGLSAVDCRAPTWTAVICNCYLL
jgi:hypothetical protein